MYSCVVRFAELGRSSTNAEFRAGKGKESFEEDRSRGRTMKLLFNAIPVWCGDQALFSG
jgi:hypothetical protein